MGPHRDGIEYFVESTSEFIMPSSRCGFNDLGALNPGRFKREVRHCREYRNGSLIREWFENVDNFLD